MNNFKKRKELFYKEEKKTDRKKVWGFIFPKNDQKYEWTNHCTKKMLFYGLSEGRIRRVLKSPKRIEEGVAERTVAVMQPSSIKRDRKKESWSQEIWVMYQEKVKNEKLKIKNYGNKITEPRKKIIISVWRYPGMTKPGNPVPIPDDVMGDLGEFLEA